MENSHVKNEIRVLGIDDMPFDKFKDKETKVVGVMYRGGSFLDGVLSTVVKVDGDDATQKISEMVNRSRFKKQIRCILLDGIAVAGFNVIDIVRLSTMTGLGVIVIMRSMPETERIHKALRKLGMDKKIPLLQNAGKIHAVSDVNRGQICMQCHGISARKAKEIIRTTSTHSFIPEPIRVAHMIGQGVKLGESKGNA
ncbi:DUF99 family protein [Candidatus Woesearchaeota archaeon]|nr:DUF99 family protein [Candidatus Woesearchaeota archaeon]